MNNLVVHNWIIQVLWLGKDANRKYLPSAGGVIQVVGRGGISRIIEISIYRFSKYTVAPAKVNSVNNTGNGASGASSLSSG